ncbi:hypothetical protein HPB51_010452 [Rhipicephalus microplus]|uniref:Uncharacterized protein n=1 Tax=Rhipicephalus microplus TaxID=6941 RepID=A0A9J6E0H6_RHIMP|nr:hypothetical protein HPB51_010452 [Rhipicephalus microplus]
MVGRDNAVLLSRPTAVILLPVNPAIWTIAPHHPFGQPGTAATLNETHKRPHQSRAPFSGLGGTVQDAMKNHFLLVETLLGLEGTTASCDQFSRIRQYDSGTSAILHREQHPAVLLSRPTGGNPSSCESSYLDYRTAPPLRPTRERSDIGRNTQKAPSVTCSLQWALVAPSRTP